MNAQAPTAGSPPRSAASLLKTLTEPAGSAEQFLARFVQVQASLARAQCGAILRINTQNEGRVDVLAVWPDLPMSGAEPGWLQTAADAAGRCLADGVQSELESREGQILLLPLPRTGRRGLVAAYLAVPGTRLLGERLELTAPLVGLYDAQHGPASRPDEAAHLRAGLETVAALNDQQSFRGAALAVVNEMVRIWVCQRVSLGILKGRFVKVVAMSHTEKIARAAGVIGLIEAAMEECLDQDLEIIAGPDGAPDESTFIARQATQLARHDAPGWVCSLPLRNGGKPVAVLTVERSSEEPLSPGDLASLRLAAELLTPRLLDLERHDRWLGARLAVWVRRTGAALVGAEHTWAKLLALGGIGLVLFSVLVEGTYTASAPFVLEASERRVVAAPVQGVVGRLDVRAGDRVAPGDPLGSIDTTDLKLQLAQAQSREQAALGRAAIARRDGQTAQAQIAQAEAREAAALASLVGRQIDSADLTAPIGGVVVSAPEPAMLGSIVRMGQPIFEIAPIDVLRVELLLPAGRIAEVARESRGQLALTSFPEQKFPFVIQWISPEAESIDGRSVFRARARLESTAPWMRPGLEGAARIEIGSRSLGWIWTRRMVNWLRIKLWM